MEDYVPRRTYIDLTTKFYRKDGIHPILGDKSTFSRYMHDNSIPVAYKIGSIIKSNVELNLHNKFCEENKDSNALLKEILKEHGSFFIKQVDSYGGKGIYKISNEDELVSTLDKIDINTDYIIEETIKQHESLNRINPNSINSLRVVTYNNEGKVVVASALLRMALTKSHIDNGSAGGAFIGYDITNNKLNKTAYRFPEFGGKSFHKHPLTGFIFDNQELPYPEKVTELVINATLLFPDKEIIGWDVAYTPNGPIIIEGNHY